MKRLFDRHIRLFCILLFAAATLLSGCAVDRRCSLIPLTGVQTDVRYRIDTVTFQPQGDTASFTLPQNGRYHSEEEAANVLNQCAGRLYPQVFAENGINGLDVKLNLMKRGEGFSKTYFYICAASAFILPYIDTSWSRFSVDIGDGEDSLEDAIVTSVFGRNLCWLFAYGYLFIPSSYGRLDIEQYVRECQVHALVYRMFGEHSPSAKRPHTE